jgi:HEAT repeat protein
MTIKKFIKNNIFFASGMLILIALAGCEANLEKLRMAGDENAINKELEIQATRIIRQGLSNSSPQIRINAVEAAAGTGNQSFMPEVQKLTKDDFIPLRFAAAVAIGDTKYSPAKNDVAQLLKDKDENVQLAGCYALVMLGDEGSHTKQIIEALTSVNQRLRANAAFLLGKIGNKNALPFLYKTLYDETSDERACLNAIEAIARLGDEKIYQKTWAMLISAYADDRVFGIRTMGVLKTQQAKDSISTMLKDELPEVRLVAAEQLGNLDDISGEKTVIDALTNDISKAQDLESKARIQTLAALAIGQIKTPVVKKFLPELLKSESQFARLAAAKAVFQCASSNNIGQ